MGRFASQQMRTKDPSDPGSESESSPPCLAYSARAWLSYTGYRGSSLAGLRRLLAAHCIFHTGCQVCTRLLQLEYEDPTRRYDRGPTEP